MKCLQLHSSLLPCLHLKLKPQLHHVGYPTNLFWLSTHEPTITIRTLPQSQQHFPSPRTNAFSHSILVAATSPPQSTDLSAFLPISGVLLLVYFVANFIVPDLLTKYSGYDELNEDRKADEQ